MPPKIIFNFIYYSDMLQLQVPMLPHPTTATATTTTRIGTTTATTSASITRTALDALVSKWSAMAVGYKPIPKNELVYRNLMEGIMGFLEQDDNDNDNDDDDPTITPPLKKRQPPIIGKSRRQQSPLVSAGYAMRIAIMTHMVHSFVSFHHDDIGRENNNNGEQQQQRPKKNINIVLLGCGMDVLGLWANSLVSDSNTVHVWEVDVPEIARAKRDRLIQANLVLFMDDDDKKQHHDSSSKSINSNGFVVFEGKIKRESSSLPNNDDAVNSVVVAKDGDGDGNDDVVVDDAPSCCSQEDNSNKINYHLIGADLRNLVSLDQSLGQAWKTTSVTMSQEESSRPTLVVVELVLAYLEPIIETDQVLEWCATNLLSSTTEECGGGNSALIVFDALGPCSSRHDKQQQSTEDSTNNNNNNKETDRSLVEPVVKAYQKSYTSQFQQKLDQGRSSSNHSKNQTSCSILFHPLGSSCERVEQRIRRLTGYTQVHACTAGTAAQWIATWQQEPGERATATVRLTVPPGELFDEHAALSLHLASYTLVVAMNTLKSSHEQFQLQQRLCPWYYNQEWTRKILVKGSNKGDDKSITIASTYYVTVIEPEDEQEVRTLFAKTYEDLCQTYTAVNKMVKSALKQELAPLSDDSLLQGSSGSAIRQHYQRMGGQFFVAVQYPADNDDDGPQRRVVGGIGVRRWNNYCANRTTTRQQELMQTYEIHRFFVQKSCRGQGIGTALLQMAESLVQQTRTQHQFPNQTTFRITATTLSLLEEANYFYAKHGYSESGEESIGTLSLKTYSKEFACAMPAKGTGQVP
jgi:GNAT superfamily N-acetyltransferase